jgi:hypothetical protein
VNNVGPVSDVEMFSSCHLGFYLESTVEICENSYVGFNHHTATQSQPPTIKEYSMSFRQAARRVAISLAAVSAAGAFSLATLTSPAGATTPAEGASGPYAVAVSPFTAGDAYSSGQMINVIVPANSLFVSTSSVNVVECAAPNGVLPTLPSECDGNTIQGNTILPNTDGSINMQTQGYGLYQVFALPDSLTLGESPSSAVDCGDTAATECVLYIGDAQGDFTQPHVFSQPFFIAANSDDKGDFPGDGSSATIAPPPQTPEVPFVVILPAAAIGLLGGTVLVRRRRALSKSASSPV